MVHALQHAQATLLVQSCSPRYLRSTHISYTDQSSIANPRRVYFPGVRPITRRLVDLPVVGFPTRLHVKVPRFRCTADSCKRKIFQESLTCADDGAKLTYRVTRWILQRLAIDRMSVSATAKALGVGWDLVNQVALDACRQLVYGDPCHLDGVRILGVDEHVWKHTRKPGQASNLVTVLVDLTPLVDGRGPARLLDMRPGRSADVLKRAA